MRSHPEYIDVAVALPVNHTFTYFVPDHLAHLVEIGKRVLIPFGKRRVTGYIMGWRESTPTQEIKPIDDILDPSPLFPQDLIPLYRWIADYYLYPIGEVIKSALPRGLNLYEIYLVQLTERGMRAIRADDVSASEEALLTLLEAGPRQLRELTQNKKQFPDTLLARLEKKKWIVKTKTLKGGETKSITRRFVRLRSPDVQVEKLSRPRKEIVRILSAKGEMAVKKLKTYVPTASNLIRSMEQAGHVEIVERRVFRDPLGETIVPDKPPTLTDEQKNVLSAVLGRLGQGYKTFLLAGVTGSGKTEIYMQLASESLKRGLSVMVLVPEIVLISQIEGRFRARFGESIAVLHSGLSAGERYDQWTRICRGEAAIVIGARSAVFAPFSNLGLIVVDEEHDASYKQESQLRYHARDLAVMRAKLDGCVALLGSATPSIESSYNAEIKKFSEVNLKKRVEERLLPKIEVVDLRKTRDQSGAKRFITDTLFTAMQETLARNEQVLLFLNRRGFASFPVCAACGEAVKCKNCDIALTLHKQINAYKCHYCGFTRAAVSRCSLCNSARIKLLGMGTEKIEDAVKNFFPTAKTGRMDRDTTRRRGSVLKILKALKNNTIDILVGTQMVAKGHDFPNITLVGIICADLSLSFPDFRAGERTFQLLAQVAGRAGRGNVPGRVILQTYNPKHFSIKTARRQDVGAFYRQEIAFRKSLNYPPFSRLIHLKISGRDKKQTGRYAAAIAEHGHMLRKREGRFLRSIEILGPLEAPISRIANQYRWQILLKSPDVKALHGFVHQLRSENKTIFNGRQVSVIVDVDPVLMM